LLFYNSLSSSKQRNPKLNNSNKQRNNNSNKRRATS